MLAEFGQICDMLGVAAEWFPSKPRAPSFWRRRALTAVARQRSAAARGVSRVMVTRHRTLIIAYDNHCVGCDVGGCKHPRDPRQRPMPQVVVPLQGRR